MFSLWAYLTMTQFVVLQVVAGFLRVKAGIRALMMGQGSTHVSRGSCMPHHSIDKQGIMGPMAGFSNPLRRINSTRSSSRITTLGLVMTVVDLLSIILVVSSIGALLQEAGQHPGVQAEAMGVSISIQ